MVRFFDSLEFSAEIDDKDLSSKSNEPGSQ
jgi:hypothetical protein